jgi:hypothetical protein
MTERAHNLRRGVTFGPGAAEEDRELVVDQLRDFSKRKRRLSMAVTYSEGLVGQAASAA